MLGWDFTEHSVMVFMERLVLGSNEIRLEKKIFKFVSFCNNNEPINRLK